MQLKAADYSRIFPLHDDMVAIVGSQWVSSDLETRSQYGQDETEDHLFLPDVVVKPSTVEEVSSILTYCNTHEIPVTVRGAGTGLSGGALPIHAGVVVAMERFNRIIAIDTLNLQATVEPGVITEVFQSAVKAEGLFYPPDPSSKGSCFIGGNLAENAGGPKAVKYGVTRDYVLNLEVVLANGEVLWTGANVLKNSTGYNLTQLMIGSEGTLGIITKVVFKLRAYPQKDITLLVPFSTSEEACKAIAAIFIAGIAPSGMEFMERTAIDITKKYLSEQLNYPVPISLPQGIGAHLLIELDGNDDNLLMSEAEKVYEVLEAFDTGEILLAQTAQQKEQLWKLRRSVSPAVNAYSLTKSEDVVVPRANLPELVKGIKEIGKKYGFNSVCYGHLGDGNLHVNIMKESISDEHWNTKVNEGIEAIFTLVVKLGGTLSGEHGIGIAKKPYMHLANAPAKIDLMRGIKKVFDPKGILNPGKIF
jgi:glycolate oxidase